MGAEQGVSVLCNRGFVGVATLPVNRIDAMDPMIYDQPNSCLLLYVSYHIVTKSDVAKDRSCANNLTEIMKQPTMQLGLGNSRHYLILLW